MAISPQKFGPLSSLAGYIISPSTKNSKNSKAWNSTRNNKLQALMLSMQIPTEANQYICSLSRGGLWSPHSWVVRIAEVSELVFKKHTNEDRVTRLPVDKIASEVLTSALVKSLWCNIIENCDVEISKECQSCVIRKYCQLVCNCKVFFVC